MKLPISKKTAQEEEIQFDLGLNEPFLNRYYTLKQRFALKLKQFETKTFVRSFANWFYIIISISLILVQFKFLESTYNSLPSLIPIYQYIIDLELRLGVKESVYLIPILSSIVIFFSMIVSFRWYNKKKYLAVYTLFFMLLSISALTISLVKLLAQYRG